MTDSDNGQEVHCHYGHGTLEAVNSADEAVSLPDVLFRGVGVALVTLFEDGGSLDAASTATLAVRLVEHGVRALVLAGSTGEAAALSPEERLELLRAVRRAVPARSGIPIVAGTGAPSVRQAVELTEQAVGAGADAVLALSPPGSRDLVSYYEQVHEAAGGVPVLGYHYPVASSPGIPLDELATLPIDGCKDSSGEASRLLLTLGAFDRPLYVGSAALLALAGPLGAAGAILALANSDPELCAAAFAGDVEAQLSLAGHERRATGRFPVGIKELTAERFGTSRTTRLT